MVMDLEEEFDVNIPDDAETKIKTVGDTVMFIEAEMKKKGN
jgi:acyl carrier protein